MKMVLKLAAAVMLALFLAGCYDYSEPDEKAWVLALGLDRGKENKLTTTMVVAIPKNIAGGGGGEPAAGGGGGDKNFFTVSMETPTLLSAMELMNATVDRRVDLSHIKWFVFSRELAEEDIGRYYAPLARFPQFRRSSYVVICEGRAEDLLAGGAPVLEDNVGKYYELLQMEWRYSEFIPFDSFHEFYIKSHIPGVKPVAALAALAQDTPVYPDNTLKPKGGYRAGRIPRTGGGAIEVMGGAVFSEGKMVGTLNGDQVGVQKLFFGSLRRTIKDVPDPGHPGLFIIVEIKPRQAPRVNVELPPGGVPQIMVDIRLEGDIISIQSGEDYEHPEKLRIVEEAVESSILEDINGTVAKSLEMGADFLGFGLHAKRHFTTWSRWTDYKWDEMYPRANVTVNVDYKVRRLGLIHEMEPLR